MGLVGVLWAVVGYSLAFTDGVRRARAVHRRARVSSGLNGIADTAHSLAATIPQSVFAMYQGMFAIITVGAHHRRRRRAHEVHGVRRVRDAVVAPRLQPARPLGLAADRLAVQAGRARLRRRYRRPHLLGGRRARLRDHARQAPGLRQGQVPPAQPAADRARRRHPVVRLVRLQRRLRAGRQQPRRLGVPQHQHRRRRRGADWTAVEWLHAGKPTALGAASGAVAGLVGITPAAGFVEPWAALVIGGIAGVACYFGLFLKGKLSFDDALDVVGIHGVGGTLGAILTGVFATTAVNSASGHHGLLYGNPVAGCSSSSSASSRPGRSRSASAWCSSIGIKAIMGLRVDEEAEVRGLDLAEHGEEGYIFE